MRHFESFELEHLLNRTGSWLFRLRCRRHLKSCPLCMTRMEKLLDEQIFLTRLRKGLRIESGDEKRQEKRV